MKLEQIEEFLQSDDLEMVKLGARFLEEFVRPRDWEAILKKHSEVEDKSSIGNITSYNLYNFYPQYKWRFRIDDKVINILTIQEYINTYGKGLYEQLSPKYRRTYKINTGRGGMNILQQAIQSYCNQGLLNQQKQNKYEQIKKAYRKQTR